MAIPDLVGKALVFLQSRIAWAKSDKGADTDGGYSMVPRARVWLCVCVRVCVCVCA